MKYIDILNLAHIAALEKWYNARIKLQETPENKIRIIREERAWNDLTEIERAIKEETSPS